MKISTKVKVLFISALIMVIATIKTWQLLLEPKFQDSIKIYSSYVFGGEVKITDLLGSVDIACAVGPFDSFRDKRFSGILTVEQIAAAENALTKQNQISLGDNQFFMVGLRGETVATAYASNFFSNLKTLDKKKSTSLDCVGGDGLVYPEKFSNIISIRLKERV